MKMEHPMKSYISRTLAVLLAMSLAGFTEVAQAQQTTTPAPQNTQQSTQQNNTQQATPVTTNTATTPAQDTTTPSQETTPKPENNASDPNYVPAPTEVLPNAPSTDAQNATSSTNQTKDQQPLGTAAAKEGATVGGAASKPAGTALAGVKQKQSRGLLIKVGAALAAGAALGTVYALSRGTSPVPPGAAPAGAVRLK
jgi:cytoskeletal protein RodZ